ncbi:hypothetical protein BBF96_03065 [Anoxybacter fermentans]|uniref:Major facilitator superfamily (MFS) profile domain-containing protein n=1 Tax=Anoxybacter fermentans TaxID=1323375 RepID=A0A3Q9HP89_9FIRM|nr:MFS transporter [Anoxybacter fermentans]AZR72453.1 hypothetical protein BBF96_03065 [Anoxybacter fermentans]
MKKGIVQYLQKIKFFNREAKLFLITSFIIHLLNGGYQVIFNLYLNSLDYQSDFIGTVASVRLIVGALLGIPLGIMTTRLGYRKTLLISGFMAITSIFGLANTDSKALIFIFSTLWGITFVLFGIITAPFLAHYSSLEERAHLFSLNFSLHMWAAMLGSFLGGSITESFQNLFNILSSYKYTLNLFGLISIVALIPIFFLQPDKGTNQNKFSEVLKNVIKISKYHDIRNFLIYSLMIGTGAGLVVPLFNIFLRIRLEATDFQIGLLISLTQIATSVGSLFTPYLVGLLGQLYAVVVLQFLSIPFLIIVGGVPYLPIVSVAYFLRTSLMNMVNPIIEAVSMQVVHEDERAAASSLIRTIRSFGRGIGVYLSGIILANGNYLLPFILTCILYLSGSLIFYFSFRFNPDLLRKHSMDFSK